MDDEGHGSKSMRNTLSEGNYCIIREPRQEFLRTPYPPPVKMIPTEMNATAHERSTPTESISGLIERVKCSEGHPRLNRLWAESRGCCGGADFAEAIFGVAGEFER